MKINIVIALLTFLCALGGDPPKISVNYLNKKQWKLSKHDLADIKLDIEREMRTKILQIQMDWENRQKMEQEMIYNQFSPVMSPPFFQPSMYPQLSPVPAVNLPTHINNYPRFKQREGYSFEPKIAQQINENDSSSNNPLLLKRKHKIKALGDLALKTIEDIKRLKEELETLKKIKSEIGIKDRSSELLMNLTMSKEIPETFRAQARNEVKNHLEHNTGVNDIISKYRSHRADKELNLFSYIFKNYTMPGINHINMTDVGEKIKHAVDANTIDENILELKSLSSKRVQKENEKKNLRRSSSSDSIEPVDLNEFTRIN